VTVAERVPDASLYPGAKPDMLVPASVVFQKAKRNVEMNDCYNWWSYVKGAQWRHPEGPSSTLKGRMDHPVVHVAFEDVLAFAKWIEKELPTEAEWEFAARGGLDAAEFAWGDDFEPNGRFMANTWQGKFPWQNLARDGFEGTSPVGSFPANGYGLSDMIGNVWEWTTDWYQDHRKAQLSSCCGGAVKNPHGGAQAESSDPRMSHAPIPRRVLKGGSFLCAPNYCRRYRPAARMAQPVDTSTCHVGFRCIVRGRQSTPVAS
jgi:formylglycine-generating enzyme required for sulfatase activity